MCETINPVGNVYCQRCNARLVPVSPDQGDESEEERKPIEGFSLPTIPLDEAEEEEHAVEAPEESPAVDWLDELRGSTEPQDNPTEGDEQTEEDDDLLAPADIPYWLNELRPISEEPPSPTEEPAAPQDAELGKPPAEQEEIASKPSSSASSEAETSEADEAPSSDRVQAPEPAEIPDWLRELGPVSQEISLRGEEPFASEEPSGEETEAAQPLAEMPKLEDTPEWLADVLPSQPSTAVEKESATGNIEPSMIEIPDWLKEAEDGAPPPPPEESLASEEEPLTLAEPPETEEGETPSESSETPSWLREAEPELEEAPPEESTSPFTEEPAERVEAPDWLTQLMRPGPDEEVRDEASPFPAELGVAGEEWSADLEQARIPDWLQELRTKGAEGREAVRGPLETEGPLKGLRGLIPAGHDIGPPAAFEGPSTSQPSEVSLARAELLQGLLGQPAIRPATEPRSEEKRRKTDAVALAERWLVASILIFSVVSVLLAPLLTGQGVNLTQPVASLGAEDLYRIVGELEEDDHVLVAFDYGPSEADELSAVAQPVLTHMLERGVELSIASTRPDGLLTAQAVMRETATSADQYRFIGYRPGSAMAVSQLLSARDRVPTLLLALTSRPTRLRLWIEQAHARYGDQLPLVVVGSATLEPVASPYLDASARQLKGAVYGLKGAAAYEALRGITGSATERLNALAAGHVAVVTMMIAGALIYIVGGANEEKE